jgi:spore maturation protein CgeB
VAAAHVPNEALRRVYSSSAIVLNDHWEDMRAHGFLSNRLYDAVACGAFVISDRVDGIEERFAGAVVTYETPEELRELVARYLADPEERAARGDAGRREVLAHHTFAHRVDTLLDAVSARMRETGHRTRVAA